MSKSREYICWQTIKSRCYNKNFKSYDNYGGRGIKMCDRWLESFDNFLEDMGRKPLPNHSIDRINNDGDYEPGNCRWTTSEVQSINRRLQSRNKLGVKNVYFRNGRFTVKIRRDKRKWNLGTYDTLKEATGVAERAAYLYDFSNPDMQLKIRTDLWNYEI